MASSRLTAWPILLVGLFASAMVSGGCHLAHECPILQPMFGGMIPAPLPPKGDTYTIVGYQKGIRFYIVKYTDNLYRGGDILSAEGAQTLKDLGVKTVVSVTPTAKERTLAREYGFTLVEIPFSFTSATESHLDRFLTAVDTQPGPIYVHGFGGTVRAGILPAHYRIHRQGWTYDQAMAEYRRLGANFWDSLALVDLLKKNAPAAQ